MLVCTTIVENGLDIPNANTIIVNEAQNFGLSDLHQLRGRVGRSNKKAYCYLLAPSPHLLPDLSRKRLQAIEQFSDHGVLATTRACRLRTLSPFCGVGPLRRSHRCAPRDPPCIKAK